VPTQRLDDAILACWPLLPPGLRRAPLILAVQQRMTTPERLSAAIEFTSASMLARDALRELIALLADRCRSELELWGYLKVFDTPGLRDAIRQRQVRVGKRTYYLDLAYETERVAVELDGRSYHSSSTQWERDIARDLALATVGWQTVRLSHRRLTTDVEGCRRDVLAVRRARRRRAEPA
jgi:very-short-patch-repair endonuclease